MTTFEAGHWAVCRETESIAQGSVKPLQEWFARFEGMGVVSDGEVNVYEAGWLPSEISADTVRALADLLGWERLEAFDAGGSDWFVYRAGQYVLSITPTVDSATQVIPAAEWEEWIASAPEWEEIDPNAEDYDA